MEEKPSVLVVGSKGHSLADLCAGWGDDFYIGDYNYVIFDLKGLTPEKISELKEEKPDYLDGIKKQIVEAQQEGLEVFCILEPIKFAVHIAEYSDKQERMAWNNYSWSPIVPLLENVPEGKKIDASSSKIYPEYLKLVDGWSILWEGCLNNTGYDDQKKFDNDRKEICTKLTTTPLLTNGIGRYLACGVYWKVQIESSTSNTVYERLQAATAPLVFLPQVKDRKRAIDVILSELLHNEAELPPEWVGDISVGNEERLAEKIKTIEEEISEKQKESIVIQSQIAELQDYKKLLYSYGYTLEDIVDKSLDLLGISLVKPAVKNKEDRLFEKGDASIPIEIRGKNGGLIEKDLNQLTSRLADKPESSTFQTRGLFILNHFREVKPENRDDAFNVNIIDKAKPWKVCLITTATIFTLVKSKLEGRELPDLENRLFNTVGVFELPKEAENSVESTDKPNP